jgi:formylmethanofuran dehydrogenase subunit C
MLMDAAPQVVKRMPLTALAALGKFGAFKPESERSVRAQMMVSDPIQLELRGIWGNYYARTKHCENQIIYSQGEPLIGKRYRAKDIEMFSLGMIDLPKEEYFYDTMGYFLSALINRSHNSRFVIHTTNLAKPISSLGHKNTKSIVIIGDVGECTGDEMLGGTIVVKGNTGDNSGILMEGGKLTIEGDAGHGVGISMQRSTINVKGNALDDVGESMISGKIIVDKSVGDRLGWEMKGGTITINGDAGEDVGLGMEGGIIRIYGNPKSITELSHGGKIYHKGKLVAKANDTGESEA